MGPRIAAHLANAKIPSLLLDVSEQAARNGLESALKGRPAAFFVPESAGLVATGSFDVALARIKDCRWIIEAGTQALSVKRAPSRKLPAPRAPAAASRANT